MNIPAEILTTIQRVKDNPSGIWENPKGRLYQGVLFTNATRGTTDFPLTIVYQDIVTEEVFSEPIFDFLDTFIPRFDLHMPTNMH